jgi:hypothetical protein
MSEVVQEVQDVPAVTRRKWQTATSWDEIASGESEIGRSGASESEPDRRFWLFGIGEPGTEGMPTVIRAFFPAGTREEVHTHACDYCEIILEGTQQVTGKWYGPGDVRVAKGGTSYGPLIAGPEGVLKLVIFADDRVARIFPGDRS